MAKSNYVDGWLYADNQRFINGELDIPVNQTEIIENLKSHYGIYDIPVIWRIPAGIMMIFLSSIMLPFFLNTVVRLLSKEPGILELLAKLLLIFMLYIMGLAIYACLILAYRLLLPQRRKFQNACQQISENGTMLPGRITFSKAISLQSSELEYEFQNPANKRVTGRYQCKSIMPLLIDLAKKEFKIEEGVTHFPHPKPKEVKIWYVNDKIHTLL